MSADLERSVLLAHFQTRWNTLTSKLPLAYPNKDFVTPTESMFAIVNIISRGTYRKSLGMNFFKRHESTLQVDIYTPSGRGTKASRSYAESLESVYQDLILPLPDDQTLHFSTPSSRTLAMNEQRASNLEDNWDRYIMEAPFYRDHFV